MSSDPTTRRGPPRSGLSWFVVYTTLKSRIPLRVLIAMDLTGILMDRTRSSLRSETVVEYADRVSKSMLNDYVDQIFKDIGYNRWVP